MRDGLPVDLPFDTRCGRVLELIAPPCRSACSPSCISRPTAPVAFLFPGLGEHYLHMATGLYRMVPLVRQYLDQAADLLAPLLDTDLREIIFDESSTDRIGTSGTDRIYPVPTDDASGRGAIYCAPTERHPRSKR